MRVQRYQRRGSSSSGCIFAVIILLVSVVLVILLLLPALPGLTLQIAGFKRIGRTDTVFANATPQPVVPSQNGQQISQLTVNLGRYGQHLLTGDTSDYIMTLDDSGSAIVQFSETGLANICVQMNTVCAEGDSRYQHIAIDLRPGGAVVSADVRVLTSAIRQRVGVVLRLDDAARQFVVEGVDVDGILYDAPPDGVGELVRDAERIGNEILRTVSIDAEGRRYGLSGIYIDENDLQLVLRS